MAVPAPTQSQTQKGKVLRSFYYQGKPLKVGESYELPRVFALEMKAANKFEFSDEPKPVSVGPDSTVPGSPEARTPEKKASGKKGESNAG